MIDMFYFNLQADANGINLLVHYNALKNAESTREKPKIAEVSDVLLVIGNVCSDPDRPINTLLDIFMPPNSVAATLDLKGIPETERVVKMQLYSRESGIN